MGVLSLSQNIFFTMVYVSEVASHLKFRFSGHFYLTVTLSRLISLFMLVVFYIFCLGISDEDALLVKYLSFIYIQLDIAKYLQCFYCALHKSTPFKIYKYSLLFT